MPTTKFHVTRHYEVSLTVTKIYGEYNTLADNGHDANNDWANDHEYWAAQQAADLCDVGNEEGTIYGGLWIFRNVDGTELEGTTDDFANLKEVFCEWEYQAVKTNEEVDIQS